MLGRRGEKEGGRMNGDGEMTRGRVQEGVQERKKGCGARCKEVLMH